MAALPLPVISPLTVRFPLPLMVPATSKPSVAAAAELMIISL